MGNTITIFTIPRAFEDVGVSLRQNNAIGSWAQLKPRPEIILFCDDAGIAEAASKIGYVHVPEVICSPYGVPLVNDVFEKAQSIASNNLLAYVNADIILAQNWLDAFTRCGQQFDQFLMVGQRTDVCFNETLVPGDKIDRIARQGKLHSVGGIDYFAFRRGVYENIPPFRVGRYGWDNWLCWDVLNRGIPMIDATAVATAIHQEHGGRPHRNCEDARENRRLMGQGNRHIGHATQRLSLSAAEQ